MKLLLTSAGFENPKVGKKFLAPSGTLQCSLCSVPRHAALSSFQLSGCITQYIQFVRCTSITHIPLQSKNW